MKPRQQIYRNLIRTDSNPPVSLSKGVIQNSSRWRCAKAVCHTGVKGGGNVFLDHDENQLWSIAGEGSETFDQLGNLILLHKSQLPL